MTAEVHSYAAALTVALLQAGELETAADFVDWAVEHLGYVDLLDLVESYDA